MAVEGRQDAAEAVTVTIEYVLSSSPNTSCRSNEVEKEPDHGDRSDDQISIRIG